MVSLRFDYRDIFRAARLAFSLQRLWIQFIGLAGGYLLYVILAYASLILAGNHFGVLWSRFGLLPCVVGQPLPWISWILFALGCFILIFSWLASSTAVARATYMHLKGNHFYTWKEALRFAFKKKGAAVIATPIAILCIAFFTGLGGVVIGLLGRIPFIGELGISLFTIVWFLASFFLVFVLVALGVSLLLTPSIIATTDDDAFEGIFQSFSVVHGQPWRLIFYYFLLAAVGVIGFGVFSFFAKHAWGLMNQILVWGMGDKFADLSYAASYLLQNWIYPAVAWSRILPADLGYVLFFSRDFISSQLPLVMTISSYILALFLLFIGSIVVSYPLAIFNSGSSIIFLILKKRKDDENLLERKDREEEEDEEEDVNEESDMSPDTVEAAEDKKPKKKGGKKKAEEESTKE